MTNSLVLPQLRSLDGDYFFRSRSILPSISRWNLLFPATSWIASIPWIISIDVSGLLVSGVWNAFSRGSGTLAVSGSHMRWLISQGGWLNLILMTWEFILFKSNCFIVINVLSRGGFKRPWRGFLLSFRPLSSMIVVHSARVYLLLRRNSWIVFGAAVFVMSHVLGNVLLFSWVFIARWLRADIGLWTSNMILFNIWLIGNNIFSNWLSSGKLPHELIWSWLNNSNIFSRLLSPCELLCIWVHRSKLFWNRLHSDLLLSHSWTPGIIQIVCGLKVCVFIHCRATGSLIYRLELASVQPISIRLPCGNLGIYLSVSCCQTTCWTLSCTNLSVIPVIARPSTAFRLPCSGLGGLGRLLTACVLWDSLGTNRLIDRFLDLLLLRQIFVLNMSLKSWLLSLSWSW